MRDKIYELRQLVSKRIEKAQKAADRTKEDADELGRAAVASWSIAGERSLAEGQASINAENLERLKKLLKEVEASLGEKDLEVIKPVSYVKVQRSREEESFYIVDSPVHLNEVTLISAGSPLGKVLLGRKAGDSVKFQSTQIKILAIE
ncbi:GreA/GreB family elongation factor [Candidatus Woesebacteria bacterium]|nr:GreA/GreB family elongation factor [Candidatus Woesebacteria bacterium]